MVRLQILQFCAENVFCFLIKKKKKVAGGRGSIPVALTSEVSIAQMKARGI